MRLFGTVERAMDGWTSGLWDRLARRIKDPVELVSTLLQHCDDKALIIDRHRILVPNAFVIELLPDIHRKLEASAEQVAPHLANQVRRHAAERGYTFAGPITVHLRPASGDMTDRYCVRSRIAPIGAPPRTCDG
nr:FhaA domain-containing protein [Streptomyces bicolor]